ncbi:MAG: tRNA guanosine(34) transglycosylase Tgt [Patescibacteria group bacterium]
MNTFFTQVKVDKSGRARLGIIHTDHGDIETPVFMPVGTQATVKALGNDDLLAADASIILGNTYHLHLRPGEDRIAALGGLHAFMNWQRPMLTDSGGFQVLSLGAQMARNGGEDAKNQMARIDEDGVTFRSHIDGSTHRFTPESSIGVQKKLGADIIMAFDECTPDDADHDYASRAIGRTHRWAEESVAAFQSIPQVHAHRQFLFGIIQGANHADLRVESAKFITALPFDGIAIGGESIGYNMAATRETLDLLAQYLPEDKPRYTMGVGSSPQDLFDVVERGVDMFDCVAPTRLARNGALYSRAAGAEKKFRINITNAPFAEDSRPIEEGCTCYTCQNHTRAYLHHLFAADELLAMRLASIHNVFFMLELMRNIRAAIARDEFLSFKESWQKS